MQYLISQNVGTQISSNLSAFLVPLKEYYYLVANNDLKKCSTHYPVLRYSFYWWRLLISSTCRWAGHQPGWKRSASAKYLGLKNNWIIQFLAESVILVFFATLFAMAGYQFAKDMFSNMLGKEIPSLNEFPLYFAVFPLLLTLIIGVIAGLYPKDPR